MTPQERQLIADLFDRLASLENTPRDADAERTIAEGLRRAPHAAYPLVQTVLVQDEALKRANARIEELEGGPPPEAPQQRGFLDNMRDTLFGREEPRGSVPPVRQGGQGSSGAWGPPGSGGQYAGPPGGQYGGPPMGGQPMQAPGSGGSSFLGTAAASAAGVIGGSMLLNGIRSMFGPTSAHASAFDRDPGASWGQGELSRQAGVEQIGRGGPTQHDLDQDQDQDQDDEESDDSFFGGDSDDGDTC